MTSAKTALTHLAESFFRRKAPAIPPASTPALTGKPEESEKLPKAAYRIPLSADTGRMIKIAVACAFLTGIFERKVSIGTTSMPPPPPNSPFTSPVTIPAQIRGTISPAISPAGRFLNESVFSIPWSMRFICVFIWHKFGKSKKNAVIDLLFYLKYYILFVTFKNLTLKKVNV